MVGWIIGLVVTAAAFIVCLVGSVSTVMDAVEALQNRRLIADYHPNGQALATTCQIKELSGSIGRLQEKHRSSGVYAGYFYVGKNKQNANIVDNRNKELKVSWLEFEAGEVKTFYQWIPAKKFHRYFTLEELSEKANKTK